MKLSNANALKGRDIALRWHRPDSGRNPGDATPGFDLAPLDAARTAQRAVLTIAQLTP